MFCSPLLVGVVFAYGTPPGGILHEAIDERREASGAVQATHAASEIVGDGTDIHCCRCVKGGDRRYPSRSETGGGEINSQGDRDGGQCLESE